MSYRLLTQLARQAAKKTFSKSCTRIKEIIASIYNFKKAKELAIQTGKKIGQEALKNVISS